MSKINKNGRPVRPIDWNLVESMLKAGSSGGAIADFLGMNRDHFYRRVRIEKGIPFNLWQSQCKAFYRQKLRVAQLREAIGYQEEKVETFYREQPDGTRVPVSQTITKFHRAPNAALLIFLGKNLLGQSDTPVPKDNGSRFGNIPNYRCLGDEDDTNND